MAKENDIVLIYIEDIPVSFARVESILADSKKDWYHIKLLFLQVPLQIVTWILKDVYINGEEFSMGGKKIRLEPVKCPEETNVVHENYSADKITSLKGKDVQIADTSGKKQNKITNQNKRTKQTEKQTEKQNKHAEIISLADIRKAKNERP